MWPLFFYEFLLNSYVILIGAKFCFQKRTRIQRKLEEKRTETLCGHDFLHLICMKSTCSYVHITYVLVPIDVFLCFISPLGFKRLEAGVAIKDTCSYVQITYRYCRAALWSDPNEYNKKVFLPWGLKGLTRDPPLKVPVPMYKSHIDIASALWSDPNGYNKKLRLPLTMDSCLLHNVRLRRSLFSSLHCAFLHGVCSCIPQEIPTVGIGTFCGGGLGRRIIRERGKLQGDTKTKSVSAER